MEIIIKVEKVTDVKAVVNAACKMPVDVTAGENKVNEFLEAVKPYRV